MREVIFLIPGVAGLFFLKIKQGNLKKFLRSFPHDFSMISSYLAYMTETGSVVVWRSSLLKRGLSLNWYGTEMSGRNLTAPLYIMS